MLPSGNDAAVALAQFFGNFICEEREAEEERLNQEAKEKEE